METSAARAKACTWEAKKKPQEVQQKLTTRIAVFSQLCVSRRSLQPLGHLFQTR
jgi:tellurite resistance-related uncharacterized protein